MYPMHLILFLIVFVNATPQFYSPHRFISSKERIVNDLEVIESPNGVLTDFSYNETSSNSGELNSVPGCPKSIDGYPWVYYGNPTRCYLASYPGPCPNGRVLLVEKGSPFGVCSCECFINNLNKETIRTSPNGRFRLCGGMFGQVHDNKLGKCYDLQQQGPCQVNQWIALDPSGQSVTCVQKCNDGQGYDHKLGGCRETLGGAGGGVGGLLPIECLDNQRYSYILKKCIPGSPRYLLVLG